MGPCRLSMVNRWSSLAWGLLSVMGVMTCGVGIFVISVRVFAVPRDVMCAVSFTLCDVLEHLGSLLWGS